MDTFLALSHTVLIIEGVVAVAIVALIVGIVVMSRRRKKPAVPKPQAEMQNYYADLQQQPAVRPDPLGTFAAATAPAVAAAPAPVPAAPNGAAGWPASPAAATADFGSPISPDLTATVGAVPGGVFPPSAGVAPAPAPQAPADQFFAAQGTSAWSADSWSPGAVPGPQADQQAATTVAVAPPAPAPTPSPPLGTPAGWLPDPSGTPDTLRYWDGSSWTQHFAQRS